MGGTTGVTIRLQRVARADQALVLIPAHPRLRASLGRVVHHLAGAAQRTRQANLGRVDQDPVATILPANLERADHRPIVFGHRRERHCW